MHRNSSFIALFLFLATSVVAQSAPQNLQFEQGQSGTVPPGWRLTSSGYSAHLTKDNPKVGNYCAELARDARPATSSFGNLTQAFDATPYRGKRIRFRAAIRTQLRSAGDAAALWLRIDRSKDRLGFFDNMWDNPIHSSEWEYFQIVADVDSDATRINIGFMLRTNGRIWMDDASFDVLGDAPKVAVERPHPLTRRGLKNLTAFARLYGYVRYFHPSDEATTTDWPAFVINGVRTIERAASDVELAQRLSAVFQPIAPTLTISITGAPYKLPPDLATMEAPARKITYWRHQGIGLTATSFGSTYHSERVQSSVAKADNAPRPETPWRADLGGVTAWIPLALYIGSQGSLPHSSSSQTTATGAGSVPHRYSVDDRAIRLADVIITWNIFQHFYPYFDVVNTDWPAALSTALRKAAADQDEFAFTSTLGHLVHELHDGHGRAFRSGASLAKLPLQWAWLENQLVITAVSPSVKTRISLGDAIVSINGRPTRDAIDTAEETVSGATPQWLRYRALEELASSRTDEKSVKLEIQPFSHPGKNIPVTIPFEPADPYIDSIPDQLQESRPARIAELEPGIFYVDPARISSDEFNTAILQLQNARGIIFDFRGYPNISPAFLTHLSDRNLASAQWHIPLVLWPDGHNMRFEHSDDWDLEPARPLLTAKIAFITDSRAISYAESCMGIVEHYKLGVIVGSPTAGTNGNSNPFRLPGGYTILWTGMKVLKQDGSRHHGVGILPTIPVKRTRAAVAAGRDEFLQAAIEAIKR